MISDLPNFLIVGAAKSATTTVHEYLKKHPDIFMSDWKEPCFFTFKDDTDINFNGTRRIVKFVTKLSEYKKLFANSNGYKIVGESSTPYLYFYDKSIKNIKETVPNYKDIRILIFLRNPVERAFSHYMMKVRDLEENLNFFDAINIEKERMLKNFHFDFFYLNRGMYYEQVKAYLEEFNNVKVVLYEDFKKNQTGVLGDIISYLKVDKFTFSKIENQNISGKPKIKLISRVLVGNTFIKKILRPIFPKTLRKMISNKILYKNLKREKIDERAKKVLQEYYKEDIKKLESLLNRDLSIWYN